MNISQCKIPIYMAYGFSIYFGASLLYMIITRAYGTPFKDSLTAEQLVIKKESVAKRSRAFWISISIMIAIMIFTRPFKQCE